MLRITAALILCFFAAAGIAHICHRYIDYIFDEGKKRLNIPFLFVTVKNQQEDIEASVRSLVWKSRAVCRDGRMPDIVVVDLGSSDDTPAILKRLEDEYDFLQIYTKQAFIDKIKCEI